MSQSDPKERRGAADAIRDEILETLGRIEAHLVYCQKIGAVELVMESTPVSPGSSAYDARTMNVQKFVGLCERLLWLLGLSDQERGFVESAASDALDHTNPGAAYDGLAIYAEWLDEQLSRTADAARVRALLPPDNSLLHVSVPENASHVAVSHAYATGQKIKENLARLGITVHVLATRGHVVTGTPSAEEMAALGWVRQGARTATEQEIEALRTQVRVYRQVRDSNQKIQEAVRAATKPLQDEIDGLRRSLKHLERNAL